MLLKAQAANLRLTTPKAFTLTLGILGTLAHFRHFLLLMTKDEAQRRRWTFYEAVKSNSDGGGRMIRTCSGALRAQETPNLCTGVRKGNSQLGGERFLRAANRNEQWQVLVEAGLSCPCVLLLPPPHGGTIVYTCIEADHNIRLPLQSSQNCLPAVDFCELWKRQLL